MLVENESLEVSDVINWSTGCRQRRQAEIIRDRTHWLDKRGETLGSSISKMVHLLNLTGSAALIIPYYDRCSLKFFVNA